MVNPAFQPTSGGGQPPYPPAQQTPPTIHTGPTPQVVISDEDIKVTGEYCTVDDNTSTIMIIYTIKVLPEWCT